MEKNYANILSLIISCLVTYSLIVPTELIFGLEDSTLVNISVDPSDRLQSADTTTEQTPNGHAQDVKLSKSESYIVNEDNRERVSPAQSKHMDQVSSSSDERHLSP